jgi:hypothetical protein
VHADCSALREAAGGARLDRTLGRSLKTQQRTLMRATGLLASRHSVEVNVILGELNYLTVIKTHRRVQRLPE